MAYLGQGPFQEFTNPPTKDSFTGDGSTVAFDMASEVPSGSQNALEVFVDNVRQEPGTGKAFTLGVDGSGDTQTNYILSCSSERRFNICNQR